MAKLGTRANLAPRPGPGRREAPHSGLASGASAEDSGSGSSVGVSLGLREPTDLCVRRRTRVAQQLTRTTLPSIKLETVRGSCVDVRDLTFGWLVIYCYPGARNAENQDSRAEDASEHRAYRQHQEVFRRRHVRVAALSSQSRDAQVADYLTHELAHTMLLDPALLVAKRLGLPTLTSGAERCYCRMTLLVRHGVIEHVFCPVERAASNPGQILTWMQVHGW